MSIPKVWASEPNTADPVVEEYGYSTHVFEAYDGTEQRVRLRRHPVGSLEFSFAQEVYRPVSAFDFQSAEASKTLVGLWTNHADRWIVPLWMHARRLTSDQSAGVTSLPLSTTSAPFQDVAGLGRYAMLWRNFRTWELVEILGVSGSSIDVKDPTVNSWAAATTWVLPCRIGRLAERIGIRWSTQGWVEGRVKFTFDTAEDADSVPAFVIIGGIVQPVYDS